MSDNKASSEGILEQLGERKSDFWWNMVYFLILAVAIGFVLVNNDLDSIITVGDMFGLANGDNSHIIFV